jgi:pimeloyl-ACP methyl ester carboxylesterase
MKLDRKRLHKIIRTVWIGGGILFFLWMVYSFQAQGVATAVLQSSSTVTVTETADTLQFMPPNAQTTGLLFYPGGLVEPEAYAPLAHAIAEQGYPVTIIKLPMRTASFGSQEAEVMADTQALMLMNNGVQNWFVAGHSRGAAIAARFAHQYGDVLAGLILIGTSHPKEAAFSLAEAAFPVTKIYATNDGLASVGEVEDNAVFLPPHTHWVEITGGNHAQFGYYGSQLGDGRADISREQQQALTVAAILEALGE